ncbi:MAG TPA: DUF2065 domain-containing protein [Thermodesulfobacteriota bacterium]|nr:DUF2065 domain-containing protein [Thermodesulfobacteriota bacterium]
MDFNYFLSVIGLILIIEGSPYFLFPERLKNFLAQIIKISDGYLRVFGLVVMLAGLIVLYLSKI